MRSTLTHSSHELLKRRWQDGTTHVVLEPKVLIERLVALTPRPRRVARGVVGSG